MALSPMRLRLGTAAAVLLAAAAPARAQTLPAVHVVATGGTISNTGAGDSARRSGDELVRGLPGIEKLASITVEQFSNTFSGAITLEQWRALAARINALFRTRPELKGVVVTHGTDTMEETAFFLDLTVGGCRPVVVTGSMRQATDIGADGPANLFNSIRVAAAPQAAGRGAMLLLNDEIFAARAVTKSNTSRMDTFIAPDEGPLGIADPDAVVFYHPAERAAQCARPTFDLSGVSSLPRVDIIYSYIGADSVAIDAAVAAGARGIVVAGVGRGGATPAQSAALRRAVSRGVAVVIGSRTGSGRVPVRDSGDGPIGAGSLNPPKARVLLMLALTQTSDRKGLAEIFSRY